MLIVKTLAFGDSAHVYWDASHVIYSIVKELKRFASINSAFALC